MYFVLPTQKYLEMHVYRSTLRWCKKCATSRTPTFGEGIIDNQQAPSLSAFRYVTP